MLLPQDSAVVSPGEVFVMVTKVQDFIVSDVASSRPCRLPLASEWLQVQPLLCKWGLIGSPGWASRKILVALWVGGVSCPVLPCKSVALRRCAGCFGGGGAVSEWEVPSL